MPKSLIRHLKMQPELAPAFSEMTFPAYRHLLAMKRAPRHPGLPDVTPAAVGVLVGNEPAGLALAEIPDQPEGEAELLSVFVKPEWRGFGVGTSAVSALADDLAGRGLRKLTGVYMTGQPTQAPMERMLERAGFEPPQARMLAVRIGLEGLKRTDWFGKFPFEAGYSVFPWADLTAAEREGLMRSQEETAWIAPNLVPWIHDAEGFEAVSSIGVRLHGEIVGWVINHVLSEDTIRFTCSFIRRDLGRRGKIVPAFSESIRRLEGSSFRMASFTVPLQHAGMVAFTRRRIAPQASFLGETRGVTKVLGSSPG